jgi:hypothetical protein
MTKRRFVILAVCQGFWCCMLFLTYRILLHGCAMMGYDGHSPLTEKGVRIVKFSPVLSLVAVGLIWKLYSWARPEAERPWLRLSGECILVIFLSIELVLTGPLFMLIPYEWISADRFWD